MKKFAITLLAVLVTWFATQPPMAYADVSFFAGRCSSCVQKSGDTMTGNLTVPVVIYGTGFTTTGVGTTSFQMNYYSNGLGMGSSGAVWFTSAGVNGTPDVAIVRSSAGVLKVTNGAAGNGNITANAFVGAANEIAVNNDNTRQLKIRDTGTVDWSSTNTIGGAADTGLTRGAAGVVKVTNGSTGDGSLLSAGVLHAVRTETATYTAAATDYTILMNVAAATVNLPACASHSGRIYVIKKIASGAGTITIDPNASETIDGAATNTAITTQYQGRTIQCNGTSWFVIGSF
jgi:hypothetical protein